MNYFSLFINSILISIFLLLNIAFFNININTVLDVNDYIELDVTNNTATNNVTAEVDSYFIVEER